MPLRCRNTVTNADIFAFNLDGMGWQHLRVENRKLRHLLLPCCSAEVVLKRSSRGTQFFAHKTIGACSAGPETEAHLQLKMLAIEAARANGWSVNTEVSGTTPAGNQWRADVLAQKGRHKIAIEVQWSRQSNEETMNRQRRYAESGVRGLWLLRHPGFPISQDLPAVLVGGSLELGFLARIPFRSPMRPQGRAALNQSDEGLPMGNFLNAAFKGEFRFGIPPGVAASVTVRAGFIDCWNKSCRIRTRIITGIDIAFGPGACTFTVPELGKYPKLLDSVLQEVPRDRSIGRIKPRFSKTRNEMYVSNGCYQCDALIGQHYEIHARENEETISQREIRISDEWKSAIESHDHYEKEWAVYSGL